jgi:hypothetical protein
MVTFFGFNITKIRKNPVQTSNDCESAAPVAAIPATPPPGGPPFLSFNIRQDTDISVILTSHS